MQYGVNGVAFACATVVRWDQNDHKFQRGFTETRVTLMREVAFVLIEAIKRPKWPGFGANMLLG